MKRILFVDDEANILDGIKRTLRSKRKEWEMEFALGPAPALEAIEQRQFDVVVSDMRMPEMDGADFLAKVMEEHPGTIRLILSGHADPAAIMRSVGVAHQFLNKPCDAETLKETIDRAIRLKNLVESDKIREVVSGLRALPPMPSLYQELVACLQSQSANAAAVAEIIGRDVAMSTRVLQLVNSAFFGLAKSVTSIERAVTYLGLDMIGNLVLAQGAFESYGKIDVPGFDAEQIHRNGLRMATYAKIIVEAEKLGSEIRDQVFLAAMLRDIGKLLLAYSMPERFVEYQQRLETENDSEALQAEYFGAGHLQIGAYLLGLWGLPNPVVEAVAFSESPGSAHHDVFDAIGVLHVASRFAQDIAAEPTDPESGIDAAYLERVGVLGHWSQWQSRVAKRAEETSEAA